MTKIIKYLVLACTLFSVVVLLSSSQKVETVDSVKVVHSGKKGAWGDEPKIRLELVRTLGETEAKDESVAFYLPTDIALDKDGNIYVLDSGNHRVQKFSPEGRYLATFGRQGQGPGDLYFPQSLDVDEAGNIYISDPNNQRIQIFTPEGKEYRTIQLIKENPGNIRCTSSGLIVMAPGSGLVRFSPDEEEPKELPKLLKLLDTKGNVIKQYGEPYDYGNLLLSGIGNQVHFALDGDGNAYLAFSYQNRIDKYSADGNPVWRADRELDYSTEPPKDKGKMERQGGKLNVRMPQMNRCSAGIDVDSKGRIWVATLKRQLKEEERAGMSIGMTMAGGQRSMSMKAEGNLDLRKTDAYRLEVYSPDGALLGSIPLDHFVDGIHIEKDRLFLLDKLRGAQFFEYKIIKK